MTQTVKKIFFKKNIAVQLLASFDMWQELISFLSVFSTPCTMSNDVFDMNS